MPLIAAAGAFLGTAAGAATVSAGIGALGTIYATGQQNKAVDKQIANQNATTQQVIAQQQAQQAQARSDFAPAVGTGNAALDALASKYGLSAPSGGAGAASSQYDIPAYMAQNPDVASRAAELQAQGVIGPQGQWKTAEEWVGQVQLPNAKANGEARTYPELAAKPDGGPAGTSPNDPMTAPAPTYERPTQGSAPGSEAFFGNYEETEDYKFLRDNALKAVNNNFGARGVLRSGAAARELMREASALSSQDKNQWFGRQNTLYQSALQQFNLDRGNTNDNFNSDRGYGTSMWADSRDYATNRDNTKTDNLFRLTGVGQSALGAVTGAGSAAAANSGNALMAGTSATNGLYQQRADNNSALAGSLAGFGQSALAGYGGSKLAPYTPVPSQTIMSATPAARPGYVPFTTMPQPRF